MGEVNGVVPGGQTPLTAAVRGAAEELRFRDKPAVVVLLTDGEETCGGDPCRLARQLRAEAYGIKNGDLVKIVSRRGFNVLPAHVVKISLPGILFVPWFDQDWDRMINRVTIDAYDEGSKQPEFKICAVKMERVGDPKDVADMRIISSVDEP